MPRRAPASTHFTSRCDGRWTSFANANEPPFVTRTRSLSRQTSPRACKTRDIQTAPFASNPERCASHAKAELRSRGEDAAIFELTATNTNPEVDYPHHGRKMDSCGENPKCFNDEPQRTENKEGVSNFLRRESGRKRGKRSVGHALVGITMSSGSSSSSSGFPLLCDGGGCSGDGRRRGGRRRSSGGGAGGAGGRTQLLRGR